MQLQLYAHSLIYLPASNSMKKKLFGVLVFFVFFAVVPESVYEHASDLSFENEELSDKKTITSRSICFLLHRVFIHTLLCTYRDTLIQQNN